jgi:nitrogen fixation protein NifB
MALELTILNNNNEPKSCGSGSGCGSSDALSHLSDDIKAKVFNHPCYSEEAHHHYARMHVAVAPACNIQCNYCNRKYDCSNESRPGVTSEKLSPEEAVKKVLLVASKIPQMTVVGIAGPGDSLANPEKTFRTFELLQKYAPDIKLCISTNGLRLPENVERLKQYNIDHVTITINMIDPEIGAKIYPWIYYNKKRYTGIEAATILHEKQMEGLQKLTEAGILCKVNSVMIPGINDKHLVEVSKKVKSLGAFLHNIMPLISEPEHGTYFGLNGQKGPTDAELMALQTECSGDMKMMSHCRQCRADAVGMLGEDRSAEFSKETFAELSFDELGYDMEKRAEIHHDIEIKIADANKIKEEKRRKSDEIKARQALKKGNADKAAETILIAVATKGGGVINQHFGHATEFLIYSADENGENVKFMMHRNVQRYCDGPQTCDDDCTVLEKTIQMLADCKIVLCSKIGPEPLEALNKANIRPMQVYELIDVAVADATRKYFSEFHQEAIQNNDNFIPLTAFAVK